MSSGITNAISEEYVHELASDIANQLNRSAPNVNLARQVLSFADRLPDSKAFVQACRAFGKFNEPFLVDVYNKAQQVKNGTDIKAEFESDNNSFNKSTLPESLQNGGLILPPKREVSPSSEIQYTPSKSKYGLDRLAKKLKLENDEKIKLEYEEPVIHHRREGEDRKLSFRKATNMSTQIKKERPAEVKQDNPGGLNKLSSSAREKLDAIRAKRSQTAEQPDAYVRSNSKALSSSQRRIDTTDLRKSHLSRDRYERDRIAEQHGNDEFDEESQAALDRDWYLGDEFGHTAGDDFHSPFGELGYDEQQEEQLRQKMNTRMSNIARQKQKESDMWEQNQMMTSGVQQQGYVDTDFTDENETRIHLFVHNLRPPFLDGQQVFTRQREPISAVRDPQSDMAVFSKNGSALVRERRQKRERQKQAKEAASMVGTTLGNVLGVKEELNEDQRDESGANSSNKFSDHLKKKQEGSSAFSKKFTVKEQRQFLPAFAVRGELLKVIQDNQGKFQAFIFFIFFFFFFFFLEYSY